LRYFKKVLICSLVSFCVLISCISSANAQACTPVVYAFRHAEDVNGTPPGVVPHIPGHLTEVGQQHADLYVSMINDFGNAHNYCPVGFVYSTYNVNPDGGEGTANPYQTAEPLAVTACVHLWLASTASGFRDILDLDDCGTTRDLGSFPHMALESGGKLYEYLGLKGTEKETPKAGKSATFDDLRAELSTNTSVDGNGLSSAIFWTSQGLNVLGQAIASGFMGIPGCSTPPKNEKCEKPKAPRNAVYVFAYSGATVIPPKNVAQYLQCFNVSVQKPASSPGGTKYYCSKAGNLPNEVKDIASLRGKVCDTTNLGTDCVIEP
jgi:hypothetical protein